MPSPNTNTPSSAVQPPRTAIFKVAKGLVVFYTFVHVLAYIVFFASKGQQKWVEVNFNIPRSLADIPTEQWLGIAAVSLPQLVILIIMSVVGWRLLSAFSRNAFFSDDTIALLRRLGSLGLVYIGAGFLTELLVGPIATLDMAEGERLLSFSIHSSDIFSLLLAVVFFTLIRALEAGLSNHRELEEII